MGRGEFSSGWTHPGLVSLGSLHGFRTRISVVVFVGSSIVVDWCRVGKDRDKDVSFDPSSEVPDRKTPRLRSHNTKFDAQVSAITKMLFPRRKGSLKMATGRRKTSESAPSACPVDDPSKFHSLRSCTEVIGPSRV